MVENRRGRRVEESLTHLAVSALHDLAKHLGLERSPGLRSIDRNVG